MDNSEQYKGLLPPFDYSRGRERPVAPVIPPRPGEPQLKSLEDVHRSVRIPKDGRWMRRMFAFAGPAYMVSVGYMDPGNWATDIEGGARFGYSLLWVLLMSNLMAVLLQTLSARLGIVTGRDLAQACRDSYGTTARWVLFVLCEIAIAACDLAEVLGTAIGLQLLVKLFTGNEISLIWPVLITALDVFLLLAIQRLGIRKMEAFIISRVSIIGICFIVEIFLSKPSVLGIARGFVPTALTGQMLLVSIGILGATVMPHNLYLHSALVQSRDVAQTPEGIRQACKFNFVDSAIALNCAFFVNAAILIVSAATFWTRGIEVAEIQQAHALLDGLLGTKLAPLAFAIALICAGQSSTITGTLAGQITMEGFTHIRIRPWLRRLITRSIAIIPAVIVIAISGEHGTYKLLIFSQVILSLQLPFAVVPLVKFTSSRPMMGKFASPFLISIIAWLVAAVIIGLNGKLVFEQISDWHAAAGSLGWLVWITAVPAALGLGGLLLWMTFRREPERVATAEISGEDVIRAVGAIDRKIRRIGVALQASRAAEDAPMLAEAISLARSNAAELLLIHVVEGVGGQYHGARADDVERRQDDQYLRNLAERLSRELTASTIPRVGFALGYGSVPRELIRMAIDHRLDLLVLGGHGHRGLGDLLRGTTIDAVRHGLKIPVLAVRDVPE
jgi:manganese transport protein